MRISDWSSDVCSSDLLTGLNGVLPDVPVPVGQLSQPGTPRYINVQRGPDKRPSWGGQYGVGLKYQATAVTNIGVYWLRYHSPTPAPIPNYGYAPLGGGVDGVQSGRESCRERGWKYV